MKGLDNPLLDTLYPDEIETFREEVELLREASDPFDLEMFLAGMQTPVFFGSGINNFGVQEVLDALVGWAPQPQLRAALSREVALSLIHISEPTRRTPISYAVFCLKKIK